MKSKSLIPFLMTVLWTLLLFLLAFPVKVLNDDSEMTPVE